MYLNTNFVILLTLPLTTLSLIGLPFGRNIPPWRCLKRGTVPNIVAFRITNPNYPGYKDSLFCDLKITVDSKLKIVLEFSEFSTEYKYDVLSIFDGQSDSSGLLGNFSGDTLPPPLLSSTNNLYLQFKTDVSTGGTGFVLTFTPILSKSCGEEFNDTQGEIISPDYPANYPGHAHCLWNIVAEEGKIFVLVFNEFELGDDKDSLSIFEDNNGNEELLGLYKNGDKPSHLISKGNKLIIKFISNEGISGKGFNISYTTKYSGLNEKILLSSGNQFLTIDSTGIISRVPLTNLGYSKAIDFDLISETIVWFNSEKIIIKFINNTEVEVNGVGSVGSLAYDWIHSLVYWIDIQSKAIRVVDINRVKDVYRVCDLRNSNARDLVINVIKGQLVWINIGFEAMIMNSNGDGSNQTVLYSNQRQVFYLTIDYQKKRYFFIDINDYSLISVDFNGEKELILFQSKPMFESIVSMTALNSKLYILNSNSLYMIPEFHLGYVKNDLILRTSKSPYLTNTGRSSIDTDAKTVDAVNFTWIKILNSELQPNATNRCLSSKCRDLCLPSGDGYRCVSPTSISLNNENISESKDNNQYFSTFPSNKAIAQVSAQAQREGKQQLKTNSSFTHNFITSYIKPIEQKIEAIFDNNNTDNEFSIDPDSNEVTEVNNNNLDSYRESSESFAQSYPEPRQQSDIIGIINLMFNSCLILSVILMFYFLRTRLKVLYSSVNQNMGLLDVDKDSRHRNSMEALLHKSHSTEM